MTTFIFYIIKSMKKKNSLLKDILDVILYSAIIIFILLKFVIFPCRVDGASMYPTLKTDQKGYSFVCTKLIGINRFDIAVINVNSDGTKKKLVKRVIGMPGDTVEYIDNKLYINGEYYEEPYLVDVTTENLKITLGDDEYFCLGDNRNISKDSRYYGAFNKKDFVATHLFVVSPLSEFGYNR